MYGGYGNNYPSYGGGYPGSGSAVTPAMPATNSTSDADSEILGLVQHLDKDELQRLLDDEDKMADMISDSQQIRSLDREKETLMASNKSLAEYNMSMQPKLESGKGELVSLHQQVKSERSTFEMNKAKLDSFQESTSLDTVLALLQAASAESEEATENMSSKFVSGRMAVEEFLNEYSVSRKEAHMRRLKTEKMTDLINRASMERNRQPVSAPANNTAAPAAAPGGNYWGGGYGPQPSYQAPSFGYQPPTSYGGYH